MADTEEAAPESPSLDTFLQKARPLNPDVPERALKQFWNEQYGHINPATLPTFDAFLPAAKAKNPGVPHEALKSFWDEHYGVFGAHEKEPPGLGLLGTIAEGAKSAGRSLKATGQTLLGDESGVIETATTEMAAPKDPALERILADIQKRKASLGTDPSWLASAAELGKAALANPKGAGLLLAEQLPNSAVALGSGLVGAAAGSTFGPVGTVVGGLAGLFGANTALETGSKAIGAAADQTFTPEEQQRVLREGAVKGGVVTALDVASLGLTNWITGTTARAVERATVKALTDSGVDVADKAAVTAARQRPEIVAKVQAAQREATAAVDTLGQKLARGSGALGVEAIGEGAGEYLGEYAATGQADKTEALIEAFSSLGQSAGEIAATQIHNQARLKATEFTQAARAPEPHLTEIPDVVGVGNPAVTLDQAIAAAQDLIEAPSTNAQQAALDEADRIRRMAAQEAVNAGQLVSAEDAATLGLSAKRATTGDTPILPGAEPQAEPLIQTVSPPKAREAYPADPREAIAQERARLLAMRAGKVSNNLENVSNNPENVSNPVPLSPNPVSGTSPLRSQKDLLYPSVQELQAKAQAGGATIPPSTLANVSGRASSPLDTAAHVAAPSPTNALPEPTPAQKEAGNYQKGHLRIAGLDISIENPQGSTRSGTDKTGTPWSITMQHHYGYFRGTVGKDKDHLDTFIRPGTPTDYHGPLFVVDQVNPDTGSFDEVKVMTGFDTLEEAREAYRSNYAAGWNGLGNITKTTIPQFKVWLKYGNTKTSFSKQPSKDWSKETAGAAQKKRDAGVLRVDRDEAAMPQPAQQALSAVRGQGHSGVPTVDEQLPDIYRGRGSEAGSQPRTGSDKQRSGLSTGQRAMDESDRPSEKPAQRPVAGIQGGQEAGAGLGHGTAHTNHDAQGQNSNVRMERGEGTDNASRNTTKEQQDGNARRENPAIEPVGEGSGNELPRTLQQTPRRLADRESADRSDITSSSSDKVKNPRSDLPPAQNAELLLRAEKAKADLDAGTTTADQSILKFLRSKGGLQDQGGELSHLGVDADLPPFTKKLIQPDGLTLDDAAELAHEAGLIADRDMAQLLDAIDRETRGLSDKGSDWYQALTTGKGAMTKAKVEAALAKIIEDHGLDHGAAVEKVKAAILADDDFRDTPYGKDLQSILAGHWPDYLPKPQQTGKGKAKRQLVEAAPPSEKPRQQEIALPPPTIGEKPIIGREAQTHEAPLFSQQAQTEEPEQADLINAQTTPDAPTTILANALRSAADQIEGKRPPTSETAATADTLELIASQHASSEAQRTAGIPATADPPVFSYRDLAAVKAHPDYQAAKGGDITAAMRLVHDLVKPSTLEEARRRFDGATFVPATAKEATGHNAIPKALAALYAHAAGGTLDTQMLQANKAYHTGADAMERLLVRPLFTGPVQPGVTYVLVDDTTTVGSTFAELANHIQAGGGRVVGVIALTNAARQTTMAAAPARVRLLHERFGDVIQELFHIEPAALTASEAGYLANFRDADALRARAATAVERRDQRLAAKGLSRPDHSVTPPDLLNQQIAANPFFSQAQRVIEQKMPARASMEQVRGILSPTNGVKPDELKWTGLDDFLKTKDYFTKAEVLDFLKHNAVEIQEVMNGEVDPEAVRRENQVDEQLNESREKLEIARGDLQEALEQDNVRPLLLADGLTPGQAAHDLTSTSTNTQMYAIQHVRAALTNRRSETGSTTIDDEFRVSGFINRIVDEHRKMLKLRNQLADLKTLSGSARPTKFGSYTLPGHKDNYRELLLTLPLEKPGVAAMRAKHQAYADRMDQLSEAEMDDYLANLEELSKHENPYIDSGSKQFRSSHFDEPNILAHVRMSDRTDTEGKKVLLLEEVQSDLHQKGRKEGYNPVHELPVFDVVNKKNGRVYMAFDTQAEAQAHIDSYDDITQRILSIEEGKRKLTNPNGVPDAPFKKTWHELALRRMIRFAAEHGYDTLAWTTGEQQAELYDLSKQVDAVHYNPDTQRLIANKGERGTVHHRRLVDEEGVTPDKLSEYVGKDVAEKLMQQTPNENGLRSLRGLDLKVGGEGMRGFYNKIIPDYLKKYAKKWGATVGEMQIPDTRGTGRTMPDGRGGIIKIADEHPFTVHSLDITPAMKHSVLSDGQPLFSQHVFPDPSADEARTVQAGIDGKSALDAARWMADRAPAEDTRLIARRVAEQLSRLEQAGMTVNLHVAHVNEHVPVGLIGARGLTWSKFHANTTDVWVNGADVTGKVGVSYETVLHELIHAATQLAVHVGNRKVADGTPLAASVKDLYDVTNAIIAHFNARVQSGAALTPFEQTIHRRQSNALADPDEIVAWALSNRQMQAYLETIPYKGKTLWEWFVLAVRRFLGVPERAETALSEVLRISDTLLDTPVHQLLAMAEGLKPPMTVNRQDGLLNAQSGRLDGMATDRGPGSSETAQTPPEPGRIKVNSKEFKKWFGKSVVVDDNGKPLPVYHGSHSGLRGGGWADTLATQIGVATFTSDRDVAEKYSKGMRPVGDNNEFISSEEGEFSGEVLRAYIRILKPITEETTLEEILGSEEEAEDARSYPIDAFPLTASLDGLGDIEYIAATADKSDTFRAYLSSKGYDGFIFPDQESGGITYIPFNVEQIKPLPNPSGSHASGPDLLNQQIADTADREVTFDELNSPDFPGLAPSSSVSAAADQTGTIPATNARDRLKAATTGARPYLLGALGLQQIAEVYGKDHAEVRAYNKASQQMEADFVGMTRQSDAILKAWDKLKIPVADKLARVMEAARFANYDPDPLKNPEAPTLDKEKAVRDQFAHLPDEAKAVYRTVRDFYSKMAQQRVDAIKDRIDRAGGTPENRKALIDKLEVAYEKVRAKVYFPFTRFGEHIVVAKKMQDGKELDREVSAFESPLEAGKFATLMKARGWTVKQTLSKEYSRQQDGAASKAVKDILNVVDGLSIETDVLGTLSPKEQLKDAINQTFLNSLPDMSYAKHFIHAKDVKGFSKDALRAFAHSALHGAHHISRIQNADRLTQALTDLNDRIRDTDEGDVTEARQVANELVKRHDALLNPNTHPVAAWLGQLGFTMSLGGVVATGVTNATQVPLITLPWLGARYGFTKSTLALGKAYKDFLDPKTLNADSIFDASKSLKLDEDERAMLKEMQRRGRIDLTQTMDLSGRASQDNLSRVARQTGTMQQRIAKLLGFTFHAPEVMNRQVTAMATYRLARERGASIPDAVNQAESAIIDTHFIYTQENRPRYMSGNVLRVLTMFKQYSQNIAFLYGRAAHLWLSRHAGTPEERQIAKKQLLSMAGLQFAAAGALGVPFVGTVATLFTTILNAFGDDDDKWDWEVAFRKWLAESIGKEAGEVVSHGVSRLTPWDLSARLGQNDLFFRAPKREREGQAAAMDWATSLAGPVLSYGVNAYLGVGDVAKGLRDADAGHFLRGTEELIPAVLRNGVKALRYELEGGMRTRDQAKQLDVNYAEKLGQFFGFSPSRGAEMYESMTAVKNLEHRILARRSDLLDQYAAAVHDHDQAERAKVMAEIREFNARHRVLKITGETVARSMKARASREKGMKDGVYLPKKREALRQEGSFANL